MKNVLILLLVLFSGAVSANELQEKKAEYYASEAVKYFKLDESKKQIIYEAKLALIQAQKEMFEKEKNGEIESSDIPAYRKENLYPYTDKIMKAAGVQWKQLEKFNNKVHPTMNAMKI